MISSKHFEKRCKERLGIPKKAIDGLLKKIIKDGKRVGHYKNKKVFYSYLSSILYDKEYKDLLIYNHYIIIYCKDVEMVDVGITILDLPKKFYSIVDSKKGKNKNDKRSEYKRKAKSRRQQQKTDDYV